MAASNLPQQPGFWGTRIDANKEFNCAPDEGLALRISSAALAPGFKGDSAAALCVLDEKKKEVVICHLSHGTPSVHLDNFFPQPTTFKVLGNTALHLSGYLTLIEYGDDGMGSDMESELEDDSEEEAPTLVPNKGPAAAAPGKPQTPAQQKPQQNKAPVTPAPKTPTPQPTKPVQTPQQAKPKPAPAPAAVKTAFADDLASEGDDDDEGDEDDFEHSFGGGLEEDTGSDDEGEFDDEDDEEAAAVALGLAAAGKRKGPPLGVNAKKAKTDGAKPGQPQQNKPPQTPNQNKPNQPKPQNAPATPKQQGGQQNNNKPSTPANKPGTPGGKPGAPTPNKPQGGQKPPQSPPQGPKNPQQAGQQGGGKKNKHKNKGNKQAAGSP